MNCANHSQTPAAAYCRTCGKPLCTACTRQVMGVIYCENCLAERVAGTASPQAPYQQAMNQGLGRVPQPQNMGPNPGLAGVLGAIPFGVGAIYNGQYTKGLVHLGIFVFLVVALSSSLPWYWYVILGICMGFFVLYQIIDSVKTARAIQAGQPAPDPFGLATMFSPGEKVMPSVGRSDFASVPVGALVLIGLGILFLLHNVGLWFLEVDTLWPVVLIALGVWLFAKRKASIERGDYRHRSLVGPAVLITIGALALLNNLHDRWYEVPGWGHTWPVILLVIGVLKLMERSGVGGYISTPEPPPNTGAPSAQQSSNEANTEVKNG